MLTIRQQSSILTLKEPPREAILCSHAGLYYFSYQLAVYKFSFFIYICILL